MDAGEKLGKYEVRRQLGRGAMGVVYEGWDPIIQRRVAIKTVPLLDSDDPEMRDQIARFRREAQAAGRLTHPNIVGIYDYGETPDVAYIVMEYVEGPTLKSLMDKQERFTLPDIVRVMRDLMDGLDFSHERGVVHRDIKPANLMLTSEDRVKSRTKIADFGIARIESSNMTQAGTMMGTPTYMSPEQFTGMPVDARTDIYASGVLLYQMLTGERPFEGGVSAIMHKVLHTEPVPPSRLAVTSPVAFDAVVAKAMAKRPQDRFSSAAEFKDAIDAAFLTPSRPATPDGTARGGPSRLSSAAMDETLQAMPPPSAGGMEETVYARPPGATMDGRVPPSDLDETVRSPTLNQPGGAISPPGPAEETVYARPLAATVPAQARAVPAAPAPAPAGGSRTALYLVILLALVAAGGGGVWYFTGPGAAPPSIPAPAPERPRDPAPPRPVTPDRTAERPATPEATKPPAAPAPSDAQNSVGGNPQAGTPTPAPATPPAPFAPQNQATGPATPEAAPQPQPPIAVAPPPAPAITAAMLRDRLAPLAASQKCALLNGTVSDSLEAILTGIAGNGVQQDFTKAVIADAIPGTIKWSATSVDAVFCPPLDILRSVAPGFGVNDPRVGLVLADGKTALRDGERIRPRLTMAGFPGYLRVDYIAHDGNVQHLYPQVADKQGTMADPVRMLRPGEQINLGDPPPGQPAWEAGEPYGTDMIIAIASSWPLFSAPRSANVEPLAQYARDLEAAVKAARQGNAQLAGAAFLLEAMPK